jgi:hypothetical protein
VRILVGLCVVGLAGIASAQPVGVDEPEQPAKPAPPPPAADGPTQTIRARVINALGRPLRGARVSVEGQSAQVTTDKSGWFRIDATVGATLVIEAEGYEVGLSTSRRSTTSCC